MLVLILVVKWVFILVFILELKTPLILEPKLVLFNVVAKDAGFDTVNPCAGWSGIPYGIYTADPGVLPVEPAGVIGLTGGGGGLPEPPALNMYGYGWYAFCCGIVPFVGN